MAEIFRFGNKIVKIWSNDHTPAHVEVFAPNVKNFEGKAKFYVESLICYESYGFTQKDLSQIQQALRNRHEKIIEKWNQIHGDKQWIGPREESDEG